MDSVIAGYDSEYVQIPIANIIGANAKYYFQQTRLLLQAEIIQLQDEQIEDYKLSIHSCREEINFHIDAFETCLKILDKKDEVIKQERRRTWVYRSLTISLLGYTIYSFF